MHLFCGRGRLRGINTGYGEKVLLGKVGGVIADLNDK
jgi:hypothetical protein